MRQLIFVAVAAAGVFSASPTQASPVPGFEAIYEANFKACVLPDGTRDACETAINAHVAALLAGNVDQNDATGAFKALRAEVYKANAADVQFRGIIDDLFELLLPNSGAINDDPGPPASLLDGGGPDPVPGSNA